MSTEHTFEPKDRVRHTKGALGTFVEFPAKGLVCTVRWDGWTINDTAQHTANLSPVVVTAKHVGKRARITDQDPYAHWRGYVGTVTKVSDGGWVYIDGGQRIADPGCAVLVADEFTPAAEYPNAAISTATWLRARLDRDRRALARVKVERDEALIDVERWRESAALTNGDLGRAMDDVNAAIRERDEARGEVKRKSGLAEYAADQMMQFGKEATEAKVQCSEARVEVERLEAMLDDMNHDLRQVVPAAQQGTTWEMFQVVLGMAPAAGHIVWVTAERDQARAELRKALEDGRAVPDPAAGLTVTPDGQRVVDADGVPVVGRADRSVRWMQRDADQSTRIAVALRLLADHAEAAEATPTVDETLVALDVVKAASTGDASQSDYDAAIPVLTRYLAARAARTGDGAA